MCTRRFLTVDTDVYPLENYIAPAISRIVWTTNTTKKGTRYTLEDSIGLNPRPKTLRDYRSKPTIMQLVNHIRT